MVSFDVPMTGLNHSKLDRNLRVKKLGFEEKEFSLWLSECTRSSEEMLGSKDEEDSKETVEEFLSRGGSIIKLPPKDKQHARRSEDVHG